MTRSRLQPIVPMNASLSRRRLLAFGTAGALSLALARQKNVYAAKPEPKRVAVPSSPFFVGFNTGSVDDTRVVAAADLQRGDPRFTGEGARFKVLGMYPSGNIEALHNLEWLTIDVAYAPYHDTPFLAYSFRNGPVAQSSSPFAVTVPVDETTGLNLLVSYRLGGADAADQTTIRLTTGHEPNTPKLAPGVYLIALPDDRDEPPDWQEHQLRPESTGGSSERLCLYEESRADYVPSRRAHVMLSIS